MTRSAWNSPLDLFQREGIRQPDAVVREELRDDIARVGFDRRGPQLPAYTPQSSSARRFRLAVNPAIVRRAVRLMASFVDRAVGRIAVEDSSGLVLASALSVHLGIPLAIVCPGGPGELASSLEGGLRPAETVCVVHDVVGSASDALATVRRLRSAGANVIEVVALLSFASDAVVLLRDEDVAFHALFTAPDFVHHHGSGQSSGSGQSGNSGQEGPVDKHGDRR